MVSCSKVQLHHTSMKGIKQVSILFLMLILFPAISSSQDSIRFSGQLSSWINTGTGGDLPLYGGARYIPQINNRIPVVNAGLLDIEFSANIFGNAGLHPFDTISASGKIKPYRVWIRYSTDQLEIRLGLQKLNFGSASKLRPLMWFDQIDPRDPLQLTDGVWGLLGRYYFLNNTNIWLWGLYGNNETRGWETVPVNKKIPEFGGRLQIPVPGGEAAITYHHRVADSRNPGVILPSLENIPENKFGFDAKWDLLTGIWVEGSLTNKRKNLGILTNQIVLNAGVDYTFGAGNGLYVAYEHLLMTNDERPFRFDNKVTFSMLSANYPVGLFNKIGAIFYYNWTAKDLYSFASWQLPYDNFIIYLIGYINPEHYYLPSQTVSSNMFTGKGIQIMLVFNH